MASHMRSVSQTIARIENAFHSSRPTTAQKMALKAATTDLYRSQCNCPYWHGAFGGLYMPHLRNAIYRHLILAENHIDQILAPSGDYIRCLESDFDADTKPEIRLDNRHLIAWIDPDQGGQIYELDDRRTSTNILATLNRRLEPYHHAVAQSAQQSKEETESPEGPSNLHDRITLKQEGLDQLLIYDLHPRKALVDHLWPSNTTPSDWTAGTERELAPWPNSEYRLTSISKSEDSVTVDLSHQFECDERPLSIHKQIHLNRQSNALEVTYRLDGLADREPLKFAVEINMAAMAGHEHDRQFRDHLGQNLGMLDSSLTLQRPQSLTVMDGWLNLASRLDWQNHLPDEVWTMPIKTVSNSEGGYESVFQSTSIAACWTVGGTENDSFKACFRWLLEPAHESA